MARMLRKGQEPVVDQFGEPMMVQDFEFKGEAPVDPKECDHSGMVFEEVFDWDGMRDGEAQYCEDCGFQRYYPVD